MSYERRKASFSRIAAVEKDENQKALAMKANEKFVRRMAAKEANSGDDTLDSDFRATASRVMAMRKRAAMRRANEDLDVTACDAEPTMFEDKGSNGVARTASEVGPLDKKFCPGNQANGGDPSVSTLKNIIAKLDKIADYCEKNGDTMLARKIDMVSNTLEKGVEEQD